MRISDWSSDVCSSDLSDFALKALLPGAVDHAHAACAKQFEKLVVAEVALLGVVEIEFESCGRQPGQWTTVVRIHAMRARPAEHQIRQCIGVAAPLQPRSEEHTSELQSLMRISYAVFCLKKKTRSTTRQ